MVLAARPSVRDEGMRLPLLRQARLPRRSCSAKVTGRSRYPREPRPSLRSMQSDQSAAYRSGVAPLSHKATNWAVEQRGIKPIAKVLLWHLADRHNVDHGCFPDQSTLARDCEISRSSVNRHITELEDAGLVKRIPRLDPITKRQIATRYVLAFEDDFGTLDVVVRVSDRHTAQQPTRVSELTVPVCQNEAEPCVTADTHSRTGNRTSKSEPGTRAPLRDEFEVEVWNEFPRNPGADFAPAFIAYQRLSQSDRLACKRGVLHAAIRFEEAATDEPIDQRLKYHQHLATFIRERGWEAELTAA